MDELLVLLDDLDLVSKLKSDPEEFIRDMFIKYDTNADGVLDWNEFANLQNVKLDDALGRRKRKQSPRALQIGWIDSVKRARSLRQRRRRRKPRKQRASIVQTRR